MVIFTGKSGGSYEYEPSDELDRGTFGAVFRGAAADGSPVAVKRVSAAVPAASVYLVEEAKPNAIRLRIGLTRAQEAIAYVRYLDNVE